MLVWGNGITSPEVILYSNQVTVALNYHTQDITCCVLAQNVYKTNFQQPYCIVYVFEKNLVE